MSYRRYISEVRLGAERPAVTLFGNRTVYDHWPQIELVCGQLLLSPQWRPAQARVSFTWQQPGGDAPLSRDELQELRSLMATLGTELPTQPPEASQAVSGLSAERIQQVALAKAGEIIRRLAAKPDVELASFACRTPTGPRLHSWGADTAAHPLLLETPKQDIHGQLIIEGAERLPGEVLLQTMRGATLERTRPDAAGNFTFTGVAQGLYRVRPVYPEVFFATPDVSVSVKRDEPTEVILRGTWRKAPNAAQIAAELKLQEQRKQRRRTLLLALLLLLFLGAGGWSVWQAWQSRDRAPAKNVADTSTGTSATVGRVSQAPVRDQRSASNQILPQSPVAPSAGVNPASGDSQSDATAGGVRLATQAVAVPDPATSSANQPSTTPSASAVSSPIPPRSTQDSSSAERQSPASSPSASSLPPAEDRRSANADSSSRSPSSKDPERAATSETQPTAAAATTASQQDGLRAQPASERELGRPTKAVNQPVDSQTSPASQSKPERTPEAALQPNATSSSANPSRSTNQAGTATFAFVVPGGPAAAQPSSEKSGRDPSASQISSEDPAPLIAAGSNPASSRANGNTPLAPETNPIGPDAQKIFPATSARAPAAGTRGSPPTVALATGIVEPAAVVASGTGAQNPPTLPAAHAAGDTNLIADGDRASGPGKLPLSASPGSSSRELVQNGLPGNDRPGGQASPNGSSGSGATVGGAIIGGVSILGGPSSGFGQTAGATPDSENETSAGIFQVGLSSQNVELTGEARPLDALRTAPNVDQTRREAAFHLDATEPRHSEAQPADFPARPEAALPLGNPPAQSGSALSLLGAPTYVQPKTIAVHLGWELRLDENLIAPQAPAVRQHLLATGQLKMPKTLRDPRTEGGFIIELPHGIEVRPPIWRDVTNTNAGHVSVSGNRAEFSWSGDQLPKGADYVLVSTEGQLWARVVVDKNGVASISVAPGASRSYWAGIVRAPEDDPLLSPADWTQRLQWRTADGKPTPTQWRHDDSWRGGRGYRIEIPLDEPGATNAAHDVGLVDQLTGWVLANPFMPAAGSTK